MAVSGSTPRAHFTTRLRAARVGNGLTERLENNVHTVYRGVRNPWSSQEYRDKAAGKIARWGKLSSGGIVVYWLAEMNSD